MRYLAICKPERHEPKPLPVENWDEFLKLCKAYFDEKIEEGVVEDCGFAPGGEYVNGFILINVESHAKAWYLLKAFPGYEIVAKYDLIPIVEYKDYYATELRKQVGPTHR